DNLEAALTRAKRGNNVEIIVVDGNSTDTTVDLARAAGPTGSTPSSGAGVEVISCPRGRGRQMNAGAARATGEVLLFLHGDTQLPVAFDAHIRRMVFGRGIEAGAFEFGTGVQSTSERLTAAWINFRARVFQMAYGDQAIFLKTDLFRRLGGFPEIPIMEDYELMRRLRRRTRIVLVPVPVITNPRRWHSLGTVQTFLITQSVILGYYIGVSPHRLAHWYRRGSAAGAGETAAC
ncbi:MAG: TIGR04283 family arsenosugar biosynthesis glycosyltransferase, partial [Planctomycetia bacterium]|nr:TIGR04283 family arsenosugar biosynthesis glycosyltransferase [Planctomycetia bacterium]